MKPSILFSAAAALLICASSALQAQTLGCRPKIEFRNNTDTEMTISKLSIRQGTSAEQDHVTKFPALNVRPGVSKRYKRTNLSTVPKKAGAPKFTFVAEVHPKGKPGSKQVFVSNTLNCGRSTYTFNISPFAGASAQAAPVYISCKPVLKLTNNSAHQIRTHIGHLWQGDDAKGNRVMIRSQVIDPGQTGTITMVGFNRMRSNGSNEFRFEIKAQNTAKQQQYFYPKSETKTCTNGAVYTATLGG